MSVNKMFEDLAANPSRNFKLDYLTQNAGNETLREVVRLALDPFTQFYIRKIPEYKQIGTTDIGLQEAISQLWLLSSRQVTGNKAIEHLRNILCNLPEDKAKVIIRIINKSLDCGVQVSTANDVWMGLIKEYPVMLCSGYDQKLVDKINFPAYVQLKEDGMRFNAIVVDGKCEFKSRNGKTIDLLGNLEAAFVEMSHGIDCVFDGELLVKTNGKIADRQTGNGILNKANKGTISEEEAAMVTATVWDVIPYMYFIDSYCQIPYSVRFERLEECINTGRIELVPSVIVDSLDEAKAIFEQYLAEGKEGIILKDGNGVWEDKRSKGQIKFKGELECDLKIVGLEEGQGKYQGLLGALLVESADGILKVSVGSGLTDALRTSLNTTTILGKIIAVKYNARIKNKQGEHSLFLPIFIELREDKDVADSDKDIK